MTMRCAYCGDDSLHLRVEVPKPGDPIPTTRSLICPACRKQKDAEWAARQQRNHEKSLT